MNRISRPVFSFGLIALGGMLVCFAAVISNGAMERALVSDSSRSLAWGPALFRALLAAHGLALVIGGVYWRRPKPTMSKHGGGETDFRLSPMMRQAEVRFAPAARLDGPTVAVLVGLSGLALVLRLWRVNTDLWFDEVLTLLDFVRPRLGDILTSFPSQNQHMFYSVLAHASVSVFGESAGAVRLPSVLFGVGSLWALFLLGRDVIGTRGALLACALLTVSYHHIWFSQNARGYMGLMFFTTLATWLWLAAWSRGMGWWVAYAVAGALGAWIHMTMAFVIAAHGLLYLTWLVRPSWFGPAEGRRALDGGARWRPVLAWLLCASLTLQLLALALPEFLRTGLHEASAPSEWTSLWWVVKESARSLRVGFSGAVAVLAGGTMVGVGWWSVFRRDRLAGLSMVLPATLAGGTMLILGHNIWPRFFFFSMGFGLLIAVQGALELPHALKAVLPLPERHLTAAGVALAGLMIVASSLTVPRCYALPKQNYTGARDFVEQHRRGQDAVVAVGLAGVAYSRYFATQWRAAQTQAELDAVRQGHSDVWLVYTIPIEVKAYRPEIWHSIEKDFEVVKVFPGTLGGGEVFVCRQRTKSEIANQETTKWQNP